MCSVMVRICFDLCSVKVTLSLKILSWLYLENHKGRVLIYGRDIG